MIQVFYAWERSWDKFCLFLCEVRKIKLGKGFNSNLENCIQTSAWDKKMEVFRIKWKFPGYSGRWTKTRSPSDVLRGTSALAAICPATTAVGTCWWLPSLQGSLQGLQRTSHGTYGTHPANAIKPTQRRRQSGKNKDSFWLPWVLQDLIVGS